MVGLLLAKGASCCVVNNKGQSVLSLAASHLKPETVSAIRAREAKEEGDARAAGLPAPWVNFRATHSDGLVYGDLDPRFLERPVDPGRDVVTGLSVNPTTRASRRANFARNNPGAAAASETSGESLQPTESTKVAGIVGPNMKTTLEAVSVGRKWARPRRSHYSSRVKACKPSTS